MSGARKARVALLGCGTVGREVAARLVAEGDRLGVELVKVLVRDVSRDRGVDPGLLTDRFDEVLDAEPDLVVELIGGVETPGDLVERALRRGIPVVTANKSLIAHRGDALERLARTHNTALAFEASVCAGVPVLAALQQLRGDRVLSIRGVINGTCNYVLTRLGAGLGLDAAVREAQERGLAEPDPSADLSGRDAAEKLCVLAAAAGFPGLRPEDVACEGIERITPDDAARARRSGRTIRLIAEFDLAGERPVARVGPALVARDHPLASIEGADNGVVITAGLAGEVILRGPGAGPRPTASAVLGDVVRLLGWHAQALSGVPRERGDPRRGGHTRVEDSLGVPHGASPARRHQLHVRGAAVELGGVFDLLRVHAVDAHEFEIDGHGTTILTAPAAPSAVDRCGRALAAAAGRSGLVLPILERAGGAEASRIPA